MRIKKRKSRQVQKKAKQPRSPRSPRQHITDQITKNKINSSPQSNNLHHHLHRNHPHPLPRQSRKKNKTKRKKTSRRLYPNPRKLQVAATANIHHHHPLRRRSGRLKERGKQIPLRIAGKNESGVNLCETKGENGENPLPPPEERKGTTRAHPLLDEIEENILARHLLSEDVIKRDVQLLHPVEEESQIIPLRLPPEKGVDARSHLRHAAESGERTECHLHPLLPLVDDVDQARHPVGWTPHHQVAVEWNGRDRMTEHRKSVAVHLSRRKMLEGEGSDLSDRDLSHRPSHRNPVRNSRKLPHRTPVRSSKMTSQKRDRLDDHHLHLYPLSHHLLRRNYAKLENPPREARLKMRLNGK